MMKEHRLSCIKKMEIEQLKLILYVTFLVNANWALVMEMVVLFHNCFQTRQLRFSPQYLCAKSFVLTFMTYDSNALRIRCHRALAYKYVFACCTFRNYLIFDNAIAESQIKIYSLKVESISFKRMLLQKKFQTIFELHSSKT